MQMTVPQAAAKLSLSRQRVHLLVQAGRIAAVQVGRTWIIESKDVALFARKIRTNGRPKARLSQNGQRKRKVK